MTGMRNSSDGVASLVFGGSHMPVLNGGHSRANSLAGAASDNRAAGAPINNQTVHRRAMEMNLERKQRGPARSIVDQYDAYLDASEEHTFSKLRANLQRQERKAEREHTHMKDAAGMSVEKRNVKADARTDNHRREKSPARFAGRDASRMHEGNGNSVASLMQQSVPERYGGASQRAPSPRRGEYTPRTDGESTDRSSWGGPYARPASPRLERRGASPRMERGAPSPRMERGPPSPRMERGGASPRMERRAPSPRPQAARAQSPFRMRPEE